MGLSFSFAWFVLRSERILLSPKFSYLPPCPPDREAAVELSFLCFHEGPVGRGDKAEHLLPSLTAGGELSSQRSLAYQLPVNWWDVALGMLMRQLLLEGKTGKVQEKKR